MVAAGRFVGLRLAVVATIELKLPEKVAGDLPIQIGIELDTDTTRFRQARDYLEICGPVEFRRLITKPVQLAPEIRFLTASG